MPTNTGCEAHRMPVKETMRYNVETGEWYALREVTMLESTYTRLLAIEDAHDRLKDAARTLIDGTGGKSRTTEYGECYVPQDADFERLAEVVGDA